MHRSIATRVILLASVLLFPLAEGSGTLAAVHSSVPHSLIPFVNFQKDFKITAGKDHGRIVALTSRLDALNDKKSQFTFGDYATVHLARNPRGIMLLERLDLIRNRSHVIYDPALPVLPVQVGAGAFFRETRYRMYNSETGKLKRSGRVTHSVQRIAPSHFDTPAGSVEGLFIEMEHRMEMEYMSELRINLGLGCREGEGPVFGTGQYKITRLGLFSEIKNAAAGILAR